MDDAPVSKQIDDIIQMHSGWKGDILAKLRTVILGADDGIHEEIKWRMANRPEGLPVWSQNGIVCFAEIWKDDVKLLFPHGVQVSDPSGLFNARLQSAAIRAIEFREGDVVDVSRMKALVQEAVRFNQQS